MRASRRESGRGRRAGRHQRGPQRRALVKLVQDFERQLHVQAELLARVPWESLPIVQPGGSRPSPRRRFVRAALRRGTLTLRGERGGRGLRPVGARPAARELRRAPSLRGVRQVRVLGRRARRDGARTAPVVAALDVVPNFAPAGLPFRIGLAVPWAVGERGDRPSMGLFLRIFYESAREIEFASPTAVPTNAVPRASDGGRP